MSCGLELPHLSCFFTPVGYNQIRGVDTHGKMIYHGSDHIIEHPEFGYGKTYNDYGTGFYCTENPNMAKRMGCWH